MTAARRDHLERLVRDAHPLDAAAVAALAPVVVLAPHPDDEALGCGIIVSALRDRAADVHVVFVSDGAASHPRSRSHPRDVLAAVRRQEALQACAILGVSAARVTFLDHPDTTVPDHGHRGFDAAADEIAQTLERAGATTVLASWRHDPHRDHAATSSLAVAARDLSREPWPRLLEYAVWGWESDQPLDDHAARATFVFEGDEAARARKRSAILRHRSQCGELITDDPTGFRLPREMIERAVQRPELLLDYCG